MSSRQYFFSVCTFFALAFAQLSWAQLASQDQIVSIKNVVLEDLSQPEQSSVLPLPIHLYREQRSFAQYRVITQFDLPADAALRHWRLYLLSMFDGGRVWINGQEIGSVRTSSEEMTVRHVRPFSFSIPQQLIRPGQNVLTIEWASRETMLSVSRIFVGPEEVVSRHYESRLFWQNTMAQISFVLAIVIASMLLGVYVSKRSQKQYLLVGLSALGWAVLNVGYFLPPMPSWAFPYWRFFFYAMISIFAACGWLYILRESGQDQMLFAKVIKFWAVAGPLGYLLNFWLTGASYFPWVEGIWGLGNSLMGVYPLYCLFRTWWVGRKPRHLLYLFAASLAMSVGAADVVLLVGKSPFGSVGYSLQAVAPIWFGSVVFVLISDFVRSLRAQDEQRDLMNLRLAQQESELQRMHAKESSRESEKAALAERERIMQDMHDGLGSQLISSLALSQGGQLSAKQTEELLRGCIDDLRLAIDASGGDAHDLAVAAGNLRFRMAPRLKAAGIHLIWHTQELAEQLPLTAQQVLAILRILQEAMANTIKHAKATRLEVMMRSDEQNIVVSIEDNGIGLDDALPPQSRGKGLAGMQKRARHLHANLRVTSPIQLANQTHPGTRVELVLPSIRQTPQA